MAFWEGGLRYRYLFVYIFAFFAVVSSASPAHKKKWTVMIFANGDPFALAKQDACTLTQLLRIAPIVAPNDEVSVVFEMKFVKPELGDDGNITRFSENILCFNDGDSRKTIPEWNGAWRFRLDGDADDGFEPLQFRGKADMDGSAELIDFIQWAKKYSPAERYILIIKKHGPDLPERERLDAFDGLTSDSYTDNRLNLFSLDFTTQDRAAYETDEALNRSVTFAVEFSFPERLNVLAFDSCSRAFIENAFALRNFTDILIASEDDITIESRWHYEDWIPSLVLHPEMSAKQLGHLILRRYAKRYAKDKAATKATLSVTDLRRVGLLVSRFDGLVDLFKSISVESQLLHLRPAPYALSNIDFMDFMNSLNHRKVVTATPSQVQAQKQFQSSYANLASSFSSAVKAFAGPTAKACHGSFGLTVYFPNCGLDNGTPMFIAGPYNPDRPDAIPMVRTHPQWAYVLRRLLAQQCSQTPVTSLQCDRSPMH